MSKILFVSFRWNDERLQMHSSDKMMSYGFKRAGWDVSYYDYREEAKTHNTIQNNEYALDHILHINPDLVFLNKCEKLNPDIINQAKRQGYKGKFVFWHMDIRRPLVRSVVEWSKRCDWVFHCKGGSRLNEYYQATQTPTSFLFAPYEPSYIEESSNSHRDLEVTWYGQLYDPRKGFDSLRREIIPTVKDLLDDYGACFEKTFIRGTEYYGQLVRSWMSISIPALDQPFYFSNRQSHIMGSGAVVLSYEFKNCFDMFSEGVDIITFKNAEELRKKIDYYLNNKDELKSIQRGSLQFAEQYLTSDRVYDEIIHVLRTGESTYPFAQVINPDNRKIFDA
jgi:hypothetical protein